MDYLKAVSRPSVVVKAGGRSYTVRKASLLQHFQLHQALALPDTESRIVQYVALATDEPHAVVREWYIEDLLTAYEQITELNEPLLIHLDLAPAADGGVPSYEYPNQTLAYIVSRLALAFGWSRETILNDLTYDEARCYLQELAVHDHNEREFRYTLSEVAYHAKTGRLQPFPRLRLPSSLSLVSSRTSPRSQPEGGQPAPNRFADAAAAASARRAERPNVQGNVIRLSDLKEPRHV